MDVRFIGPTGVTEHPVDELAALLGRGDGLVWVDIPTWDDTAAKVLNEVFTFHPLAIRDCAQRNKHTKTAIATCKSLAVKKVSPHVLRHTCAMNLRQAGVDTSTIALWMGHESTQTTQIYLYADLRMKEQALSRTTPPDTKPGRYHPPDQLLAFLEKL